MQKAKQSFLQATKRFFEPIKEKPRVCVKGVLLIILRAIFPNLTILLIQQFLIFMEKNNIQAMKFLVFFYIILFSLRLILGWHMKYWGWTKLYYTWYDTLQKKRMKNFIYLDITYVEKNGTGKIINIIDKGLSKRSAGAVKTLRFGFTFLVDVLFAIGIIFFHGGGKLVVGFLIILFLVQIPFFLIAKKSLTLKKRRMEVETEITRHYVKMIMAKQEILQNNKIEQEVEKSTLLTNQAEKINMKLNDMRRWVFSSSLIITQSLTILLLIYITGGYTISLPSLTTLLMVIARLGQASQTLSDFLLELLEEFVYIRKLWNFFDNTPQQNLFSISKGQQFVYKSGNISLENISFFYDNRKPIFEKFSLAIQGGKKTAIVGDSGVGKSTLLKLIAGYIKPKSGRIVVDGQILFDCTNNNEVQESSGIPLDNHISLLSYYRHIGYLTQEPSVFDGTIRENLIYGLDKTIDIDSPTFQEHLATIIKLAKCEFIREFEKGLQTEIGERGIRLSGGQKQRLAIAKIMLKNPHIILLDEPTSALDSFNEELISQALMNLFHNRTVIIVAHRLQTVKNADVIYYMEEGKIIESGTHEELIKRNGKYKRMLDLQSGF